MKTFLIKSSHDVCVDDWNNGEMEHVNAYNIDATIKAENVKEAIKTYFDKTLYFNFDFCHCDFSEDGLLFYSVLVDDENMEITKNDHEFEDWKNGEIKLYSNHIMLECSEISPINIENEIRGI